MAVRGQRRIVLFVAAIVVPCLVLVSLSLRMIAQEGELAEKRLADGRRLLASQIRQETLARLERIKVQAISAPALKQETTGVTNAAPHLVALVGRLEEGRLVLPWEDQEWAEEFQRLLAAPGYGKNIALGEESELTADRAAEAVRYYRRAIDLAGHPAQIAYGQLLLSRALVKSGRQDEAGINYQHLLLLPARTNDENGVPVWLYAAERLFRMGSRNRTLIDRIATEMASGHQFSPAAAYLLAGLLKGLSTEISDSTIRQSAEQLRRDLSQRIGELEQALALEKDLPNLGLARGVSSRPGHPESLWAPYGEKLWLVTAATAPTGDRRMLVAVRAGEMAAELNRSSFRLNDLPIEMEFVAGKGAGGELLGEEFPDLRVTFRGSDENALRNTWNTPRSFYLIALFLVLSVTLFGSYLLWRDVRRELRMADLRSQFVSSVSHELKTPLTSIRMFAETLRLGRVPDRRVEVEYLETIVAESERLTRLLNNILDFSKIEQGTKSYRLQPTSLAEVARASIQALEHPLAQQGFDLHVDLDGDLPAINADRDSLEQAILNLLTNAMKYSGESRRISLRLSRQNGDAVIEVGDSGLGIAPEEQHRVFDKFYRGSAPEIGLIAGTGLGLTLVAHIARAHGGRVKVQSEPGNGSTFFIHIPLEIEP